MTLNPGEYGVASYRNRVTPTTAPTTAPPTANPTITPTEAPFGGGGEIAYPAEVAQKSIETRTETSTTILFPLYPANETAVSVGCYTDSIVGYLINGVPLFSWAAESGSSYTVIQEEVAIAVPMSHEKVNKKTVVDVGSSVTDIWHPVSYLFESTNYDNCNGHLDGEDKYHRKYTIENSSFFFFFLLIKILRRPCL